MTLTFHFCCVTMTSEFWTITFGFPRFWPEPTVIGEINFQLNFHFSLDGRTFVLTEKILLLCASIVSAYYQVNLILFALLTFLFYFLQNQNKLQILFFLKIIGPPRSTFEVGIVALYWHLSFSIMPYNKEWDRPRTTDTQWRHKSKKSENLGQCGRQNMLRPYLKI